ncbi:hypothetical protein [uncultured Tolumonas sp.]|uniref:hypothetical protein n=1 Tax=uncultured Tolumonas sp. TaxID=263765 RepID=UPI00292FC62C|nr:hypothetical protein [uncultured Tolumonas sp.]
MPLLKNSVIANVIQTLNLSSFCKEDFDVKFPDNGSCLVSLEFLAKRNYFFEIIESSNSTNPLFLVTMPRTPDSDQKTLFKCRMSPGEYKNQQTKNFEDLDSAISFISTWINYIKDDLKSTKNKNSFDFDDITKEFQDNIDKTINNPDDFFTENEADELRRKLDAIQERVSELERTMKLSEAESSKLSKTIDKTKSELDVYPKGVWYKTAANKMLKVIKEILKTSEGRQALYDLTKKLIDNT